MSGQNWVVLKLTEMVSCGAGDGIRTHDILLGKQTLYP